MPAPAPDLIATTFTGQVEPDRGGSVIVSTAIEEVRIAPAAIAEALCAFSGRTVTLHGWIVDEPQATLVMVVARFEVDGERSASTTGRPGALQGWHAPCTSTAPGGEPQHDDS